jgi:hypothetical protein
MTSPDSLLGRVVTLGFGSHRGKSLEVVDVHRDFFCSKSTLEFFQIIGLREAEIVALPFTGAGGLDRATMEELVRAGATRTFFIHRTPPVGDLRTPRQVDYAGDRLAVPPRYPHSATLTQPVGYCRELFLRVLALRKPTHQS